MLIIINATGLKRLYLMPRIEYNNDKKGVWYSSVTWLFVEFVLYSRTMGSRMIEVLNQPTGTEQS